MSDCVASEGKGAGLGDFLRTVKPGFPSELMTPANFARLERLMDLLPPAYGVVYEFWLDGVEPKVDLQCYFHPGEGLSLADEVPLDSPVWRAVRGLMIDWRDQGQALYDGFWLEFDLSSGGSEAAPRVGFAMDGIRDFDRYVNVHRHTVDRLPDGGVPVGTELLMRRCFDAFPEDAYLYGTGYSYMKGALAVRWCIGFPGWEEIPEYLSAVGWPGNVDLLRAEMPRWPGVRHIALAVDFYEGLMPRVGLEYYLNKTVFDDPAVWQDPLAEAARRGWLHPRWPPLLAGIRARYGRRDAPRVWPAALAAAEDFSGREAVIALYFAHIKAVFDGAQFTGSKNYVYSTYDFAPSQSPHPN
jgi:hypothetical protein